VDWLTATHGLWDARRCWHPEAWWEIARALTLRPPPSPDVEPNGACSFVARVLDRVGPHLLARTGWEIGDVVACRSETTVRLTRGEATLELIVGRADRKESAYRRGKRWSVRYRACDGLGTPDRVRAIELVHLALEWGAERAMQHRPAR
jgi:hypothetical protein